MYNPKIHEDLIPRLWRLAKTRRMPMTKLVSAMLRRGLEELEAVEVSQTSLSPQQNPENNRQRGGER